MRGAGSETRCFEARWSNKGPAHEQTAPDPAGRPKPQRPRLATRGRNRALNSGHGSAKAKSAGARSARKHKAEHDEPRLPARSVTSESSEQHRAGVQCNVPDLQPLAHFALSVQDYHRCVCFPLRHWTPGLSHVATRRPPENSRWWRITERANFRPPASVSTFGSIST
jgi:hypothetical protein